MELEDVQTFTAGEKIGVRWGTGGTVVEVKDAEVGWRDGPFEAARKITMQLVFVQDHGGRVVRVPANECIKQE